MDIYTMLTNRAQFPDTFEITAPTGEKVSLGDFRQVFFAREAELNKMAGKIQEARGELAVVFQNLMADREALAGQKARPEGAQGAVNRNPNPAASGDDRMARLEAALAESDRKLNELRETTVQSVLQYVDDRFRSDLAGVELPEGVTPNDVIKFAQANNIMSGKIPD